MARTTRQLTNTEVKQARAKVNEYNLADGRGLALRVKPNGGKYWIFNYSRPYSKKRTNIGLGTYPEVSLAEARNKRDAARELLAKNLDPRDERVSEALAQQSAMENTLQYVAEKWFDVKKHELTAGYADDLWNSLANHVFLRLGKVPIRKILAPDVIDTLKHLVKSGRLESVKRICQRLNQIMVFGVNTGIVKSNPLAGISHAFPSPKKTHLPTIKPEELPEFLHSLSEADFTPILRTL